jgi:hypothetical protein
MGRLFPLRSRLTRDPLGRFDLIKHLVDGLADEGGAALRSDYRVKPG